MPRAPLLPPASRTRSAQPLFTGRRCTRRSRRAACKTLLLRPVQRPVVQHGTAIATQRSGTAQEGHFTAICVGRVPALLAQACTPARCWGTGATSATTSGRCRGCWSRAGWASFRRARSRPGLGYWSRRAEAGTELGARPEPGLDGNRAGTNALPSGSAELRIKAAARALSLQRSGADH